MGCERLDITPTLTVIKGGLYSSHSDTTDYRFGYNGMEKDKEIKGDGNSYTTEFRQYDPRLGRWLTTDPLANLAPGWTPYRFGFNNPVINTDPTGLYETKKEMRKARREAIKSGQFESVSKGKKNEKGEYYFVGIKKSESYVDVNNQDGKAPEVSLNFYFKKTKFEKVKKEQKHGIFYTSPYDLAQNPEWLQQRAKCASIDKLFETLFWEGTMLVTGEEFGNLTIKGISYLYKAYKARNAVKAGEKVVEEVVEEVVEKAVLSEAEILRIQNAATRIKKPITVVGSRAKGTANAYSDWDYVIQGLSNKDWNKIKNSIPGARSIIDNTPRNIDIFNGPINTSLPHITIFPF